MIESPGLREGARNLLLNCCRLNPDERVLVVHEQPELGWYDQGVCDALAETLQILGNPFAIMPVGAPGSGDGERAKQAVTEYDCTIFLARIGDQDRFDEAIPGHRTVMVYARTAEMLASRFGTTDHRAMLSVKETVNRITLSASEIVVTCPLGTRLKGRPQNEAPDSPTDVSVMRFPMGVPAPIEAANFTGTVAISRFLTPTGSKAYEPASLEIEGTVLAAIESGRIVEFDGNREQVRRIENHYKRVSEQFEIDRNVVHSWHAGIHPACGYDRAASENPDRWSNFVFPNPRFAHFHTCGNYAPGEICWMVLDPTISVDGVNLWECGKLELRHAPDSGGLFGQHGGLQEIFEQPVTDVGL